MITHSEQGNSFWDIERKGGEAAAEIDHVKLIYLNDPTASKQAQLVINAVNQHVDGIAVTLAFPDAMKPAVKQAEQAGIPVIAFNAGYKKWKKLGALEFIGQDETLAGKAVGRRLNSEGAKSVVCVDHQQGAVQLEERCAGIKKTFHGHVDVLFVPGFDMSSARTRIMAKLQQNPKIDYVVTLGSPFVPVAAQAVQMAGSQAKVGTFDLDPRAVRLIQQGKVQWAVDQQPYLQGYEAIDLLYRYKINGNILGGGKMILTGPTFVTQKNADQVAKAVKAGIRG
jgi:simple sugar transport system substrate-binding protein